jgi:hypothetical protein
MIMEGGRRANIEVLEKYLLVIRRHPGFTHCLGTNEHRYNRLRTRAGRTGKVVIWNERAQCRQRTLELRKISWWNFRPG